MRRPLLLLALLAASLHAGAQDAAVATFDDATSVTFTDQNFYNGAATGESFTSGGYTFRVDNFGGWWDGYALSRQTDNTYATLDDQYKSAPGGSHSGDTFCVAFPYSSTYTVTPASGQPTVIAGMWVTNTAYALDCILKDGPFSHALTPGGYFRVVVHGTRADGTETSVTRYLADLRADDPSEHFILKDWTYVSLRELGPVASVWMELEGSDVGDWGLNTAAYLAIDDFGADAPQADAITAPAAGTAAAGAAIFGPDGARREALGRGLNIVRSTDAGGRPVTRKVYVR